MSARCHICNGDVANNNDKGILLALVYSNPMLILSQKAQHIVPGLFPGARASCKGSPSIAQYIKGQRKDTRTGPDGKLLYPIAPDAIDRVRAAWDKMQKLPPVGQPW